MHSLVFSAVDSGEPPATAEMEVIVTVKELFDPIALIDLMIKEIQTLNLSKKYKSKYLHYLKKVKTLIKAEKAEKAIKNLELFISRLKKDIKKGKVNIGDSDLIKIAEDTVTKIIKPGVHSMVKEMSHPEKKDSHKKHDSDDERDKKEKDKHKTDDDEDDDKKTKGSEKGKGEHSSQKHRGEK